MTHLSPTAPEGAPQHASTTSSFATLLGDRSRLRAALAHKRERLASLEAAWVATAEADAAAGRHAAVRMDNRETWDRTTWDRYLTAATKHEPDFMPQIQRLLREIAAIEKLLALPAGHTTRAT